MPDRDLEHPDIRGAGMSDDEKNAPHCPVCGKWCDTIYRDRYGRNIGCDNCVKTLDAWEVSDCFPDEE